MGRVDRRLAPGGAWWWWWGGGEWGADAAVHQCCGIGAPRRERMRQREWAMLVVVQVLLVLLL